MVKFKLIVGYKRSFADIHLSEGGGIAVLGTLKIVLQYSKMPGITAQFMRTSHSFREI